MIVGGVFVFSDLSHEYVFEVTGRLIYFFATRIQMEPDGMQLLLEDVDFVVCQTCGQEEGV